MRNQNIERAKKAKKALERSFLAFGGKHTHWVKKFILLLLCFSNHIYIFSHDFNFNFSEPYTQFGIRIEGGYFFSPFKSWSRQKLSKLRLGPMFNLDILGACFQ